MHSKLGELDIDDHIIKFIRNPGWQPTHNGEMRTVVDQIYCQRILCY